MEKTQDLEEYLKVASLNKYHLSTYFTDLLVYLKDRVTKIEGERDKEILCSLVYCPTSHTGQC